VNTPSVTFSGLLPDRSRTQVSIFTKSSDQGRLGSSAARRELRGEGRINSWADEPKYRVFPLSDSHAVCDQLVREGGTGGTGGTAERKWVSRGGTAGGTAWYRQAADGRVVPPGTPPSTTCFQDFPSEYHLYRLYRPKEGALCFDANFVKQLSWRQPLTVHRTSQRCCRRRMMWYAEDTPELADASSHPGAIKRSEQLP
jgi:hypothetical protein